MKWRALLLVYTHFFNGIKILLYFNKLTKGLDESKKVQILDRCEQATTKYKNIQKNRWVSLLIDTRTNTDRDYTYAEAVTITGTARTIR